MKEQTIELSELLRGMTDGERTILWQAMTIDILRRLMQSDDEQLAVQFAKLGGEYFAQIVRLPEGGEQEPVMEWHGGPAIA